MTAIAFFPMSGFSAQVSSNVWTPSLNAVSSRPLAGRDSFISTPTAFQVPFSPGSVNSTRRNPSLQTRPPTPPGNSPRVCAYGANVAAICLFGGKSLPVELRIETRPAPLRLAVAEVGPSALRGLVFQSPNTISIRPLLPTLRHHRPSAPEHPCFLTPCKKSRRAAVRRSRDRFRRGGAFRFHQNRLLLARRSAAATALPGRRRLRSSQTTHRTLARGMPARRIPRAGKRLLSVCGEENFVRKPEAALYRGLFPSRILRSRFAGCDPPCLPRRSSERRRDGALMATGTKTRTSGSEESSGFFGSFCYDGCVFHKMRKSRGVIWHKLGDSRRF